MGWRLEVTVGVLMSDTVPLSCFYNYRVRVKPQNPFLYYEGPYTTVVLRGLVFGSGFYAGFKIVAFGLKAGAGGREGVVPRTAL